MTLWLASSVLIAGTLTALVWPLMVRHQTNTEDPELLVYADQLEETERDVERGLLSEQDASNLRAEITRRMERFRHGQETHNTGADETVTPRGNRAAVGVVCTILLIGSFGVYANLGSPDKRDLPLSARSAAPQVEPAADRAAKTYQSSDLNRLADKLSETLVVQPHNVSGWMLLGRTYMTLARWQDAAEAYAHAHTLSPGGQNVAASYVEALYMANNRSFNSRSKALLQATLKANPRDAKSLFYWGLAQAMDNQHEAALQIWTDLRAISQPDAPWLPTLTRRMKKSAEAIGIEIETFKPAVAPVGPSPHAHPPETGPTQEDIKAAKQLSSEERIAFIRSMVDGLAQRLRDNPGDLAGWKRLARAYQVLGDTKNAHAAESRIRELEHGAP